MNNKGKKREKENEKYAPRNELQKYSDYRTEAKMYLSGSTIRDIGKRLGISDSTVSDDLKRIRAQWKKSMLIDFDERVGAELERIDALEHEYTEGYLRSKGKRQTIKKKIVPMRRNAEGQLEVTQEGELIETHQEEIIRVVVEEQTITEDRDGNPEWLNGIGKCIEMRLRIFGISKVEPTRAKQIQLPPEAHSARIALFYAIFEQFSNGQPTNGDS